MKKDNLRRKAALLVFMLFGFLPLFSQNEWTKKADFFEAREGAASFTINNRLYVGTGDEKNDLWEYDPATNVWTQKASMPVVGRSYAIGFSIGNKGYIATGLRKTFVVIDSLMRDVWEYDPAADTWTKKANLAGKSRARAVAFVLNNKAYVGSGETSPGPIMSINYPNRVAPDFWVFDPVADTWNQIADIPLRRMNAIAFSSNGKGFVGTGFYNPYTESIGSIRKVYDGDNLQDLWAYDTATNTWAKKSDFPGDKRMGMSVFSIGDTAYAIAGAKVPYNKYWTSESDTIKGDVWAYNTATDTWIQKPDFPDTTKRRYSIAAAIAGKGYYGTGGDSELWEYTPFGNVLPVTLVSFAGAIQNNKTKLAWTVENEQNLDRYEVYKSLDGVAFKKSEEVKALNKKQYGYEDDLSPAQIVYYRLKIVDKDGSFSYSKTIALINNKAGLKITSFYPSPLKGNTGYLNISSGKSQKLQVVVTDIAGHLLSTHAISIIAGSNKIPITFGKLAAGTYLLRVLDEKNVSNTIRFVKG